MPCWDCSSASSASVGIIPILTLLLFSIIPRTSTLSNGVFLSRSLWFWLDYGTKIPNLNRLRTHCETTVGRSLGPFELEPQGIHLELRPEGDVRATNIVLQGLPKDIYKLINHNIEAKVIWDNIKMLLAGSELTKEDRESQLYDEFERFKMLLGENINEYYVRFYKLVNDMRNIIMIMPNIQLNSKFVNNMSPEWDRFVTAVKLNKGLKETNHEQLYAYLKQHEKHAAQD
ncbi:hypothetical protein Tco_0060833 [Tanacetum coccineum]